MSSLVPFNHFNHSSYSESCIMVVKKRILHNGRACTHVRLAHSLLRFGTSWIVPWLLMTNNTAIRTGRVQLHIQPLI